MIFNKLENCNKYVILHEFGEKFLIETTIKTVNSYNSIPNIKDYIDTYIRITFEWVLEEARRVTVYGRIPGRIPDSAEVLEYSI